MNILSSFWKKLFTDRAGYGVYQRMKKKKVAVPLDQNLENVINLETLFENNVKILLSYKKNQKTWFFSNFLRLDKELYRRPWYLILGSENSGKSDLLRNCELHYPMLEKSLLQTKGLNGTAQCDWWFFDDAIFLDTPGRYSTHMESIIEWHKLLTLIKQYRACLSLNGVIVTVSIEDLLYKPEKCEKDLLCYRKRIDEINVMFKLNIPVQVVFTKMDCIQGFEEFILLFSKEAKKQAIGLSLSEMNNGNMHVSRVQAIKQSMVFIGERFNAFAIQHIRGLTDIQTIDALNFSFYFRALIEPVLCVFQSLSLPNTYQSTPHFAGLWFTAQKIFVRDLFLHIVAFKQGFKEQIGDDVSVNNRYLALVCSVAIVIIPHAALLYSYFINKNLVDLGNRLTQSRMLEPTLNYQLALYQQIEVLHVLNAKTPLSYKIARYKGYDVFLSLKHALFESLNSTVLKITQKERMLALQNYVDCWLSLSEFDKEQNKSAYYQSLKSYLMLYGLKYRDVDELKNIVVQDYANHDDIVKYINNEQISGMIGFYLKYLKDVGGINEILVATARQHLFSTPNIEMFNKMLQRVENSRQFQSLKVKDLVSRFGSQWLNAKNELSALYTIEAWESFVQPSIKRMVSRAGEYDWVLDKVIARAVQDNIECDLRAHYFSQYKKAWELFLSGIEIQSFDGLADTNSKLEELCSPEGPLFELIKVTAKHTQALSATVPELKSWDIAGFTPVVVAGVEKPISENLDDYLRGLHAVRIEINQMINNPNMAWMLHAYVQMILNPRNKVQEHGQLAAVNEEMECLENTGLQKAASAIYRSRLSTKGTEGKRAFSNLLLSIVRESWKAIVKESVVGLQDKWNSEVVALYHQKLGGTFPFIDSEKDATMSDVMEFFHPEYGKLWTFVQKDLQVYLKQEGKVWSPRIWLGIAPEFSATFLDSINHASRITKAMFHTDKYEPFFQFELYPEPSSALTEFSLETCGQEYRYRNEPEEWRSFEWSFVGGKYGTKIVALKKGYLSDKRKLSNQTSPKMFELKQTGAWGLLRLLKKATVLKEEGKQEFWLQWDLMHEEGETVEVTFKFKSLKPENVLEELVLKAFHLSKEVVK